MPDPPISLVVAPQKLLASSLSRAYPAAIPRWQGAHLARV